MEMKNLRRIVCTQVTLFSESIKATLYAVYFSIQEKEISLTHCMSHYYPYTKKQTMTSQDKITEDQYLL